jgi:L-amino acid N-acyltransferase YncA
MLRVGVLSDIERCIELAGLMHKQSTSSHRPFVPQKLHEFFTEVIRQSGSVLYVFERNGMVQGGIVASIAEEFYNHDLIGFEHAHFVHPAFRHGFIALRLMTAFQEWAKELGAVEIRAGITTGNNVEGTSAFYKAFGMVPTGPQFTKRIR